MPLFSRGAPKSELRSEGWLIDAWAFVFNILGRYSLLTLLRWMFPGKLGRNFIDAYVAAHTFAALACFYFATRAWDDGITLMLQVTAVYGVIRVVDIFCYQINVLLFDQYRAWREGRPYLIHGYRRMVVLIAHNYWEMIAWFGLFYVYLHRLGSLSYETPKDFLFLHLLRQSMLMMLSYNTETLKAASSFGVAILSLQSIVGLLLTVVVFARFLSLLPPPSTHADAAPLPAKRDAEAANPEAAPETKA